MINLANLSQTVQPTQQTLNAQTTEYFYQRHIGPDQQEIEQMLKVLGFTQLDDLIQATIPASIYNQKPLHLPDAQGEAQALARLKDIAHKNQIYRSFIGMGYYNCYIPTIIQRNILENPGWYTAYTPYQAEIAQGRLEALLNFQTMVISLTGLDIANASLLDEATAAAEAMSMSYSLDKQKRRGFFVDQGCHPQTVSVLQTRANPLGIELIVGEHRDFDGETPIFGALLQYPATDGTIYDYRKFIEQVHAQGALVTVAADLLSLALLTSPGELGADIAVGNSQRFGVPLGYGGPHAAYLATREVFKRSIPGRIVGVSQDKQGQPALRLALQTREQHIRRDKATSNICTAQVLLAVIAGMYAVYHGPKGIKSIAERVRDLTAILAEGIQKLGYKLRSQSFFDTIAVQVEDISPIRAEAQKRRINLRYLDGKNVGISLDETTSLSDVLDILSIFSQEKEWQGDLADIATQATNHLPEKLQRTSPYLTEPIFNTYHSETELLRYLHKLESKDLSLTTAMIPLGSCTMKLNATSEMLPVSWPEFNQIHPFAPLSQTQGYQQLFSELEAWLAEITGFAGISLQPNAGSQGEYAGLQVIRQYHLSRGEKQRQICLIPESAHGTNPASAVMCGMKVVPIKCDRQGNIDVADLQAKAAKYAEELAALMITYPSTHGVFESAIKDICAIVHSFGGQVYLDGANMNAQVGLCRPGDFGADVCHLNLHKTFCIPHGGGGPGMGPIGVASHLLPFLPDPLLLLPQSETKPNPESIGSIAAAPWGSASILTISWMYISMMGAFGLTEATKVAILNANYLALRLAPYYPILFTGPSGLIAHECIIDLRPLKKAAGIEVDDIAKRLMDYGFHAPTVSWPVAGTMMIEPTESESKSELDRFCEAMISIRQEIAAIERGEVDATDNLLKNAPHTASILLEDSWEHPYTRAEAAYPSAATRAYKYWPPVSRIDNAYGDRHLVCACGDISDYLV